MVFRDQDCQEVTNCEIVINNIPLNNDLSHTLRTEKVVLYLLPLHSSGVVLIFSKLTLVIFIYMCNVNFLNNTVAVYMVHPYGCFLFTV